MPPSTAVIFADRRRRRTIGAQAAADEIFTTLFLRNKLGTLLDFLAGDTAK